MIFEPRDPVFFHAGDAPIVEGDPDNEAGWYFWDEAWANWQGPWPTEDEANVALTRYEDWLNDHA